MNKDPRKDCIMFSFQPNSRLWLGDGNTLKGYPCFYLSLFQAFLILSVAGTRFHGYFFAFHLLNIVNNNQLLSGVIKAVTQNGTFNNQLILFYQPL